MKKSKNKIVFILIILVAIGGGVGYALYTKAFKADDGSEELSLFTAEQGPLTISIVEAATINARDVEIIKSQVEGNTTVLWVIEEATRVKKGDKLIQLDDSGLKDDKLKQDLVVLNAKTSYNISKENLKVAISKAKSDVATAKLARDLALLDREKYVGKNNKDEDAEYNSLLVKFIEQKGSVYESLNTFINDKIVIEFKEFLERLKDLINEDEEYNPLLVKLIEKKGNAYESLKTFINNKKEIKIEEFLERLKGLMNEDEEFLEQLKDLINEDEEFLEHPKDFMNKDEEFLKQLKDLINEEGEFFTQFKDSLKKIDIAIMDVERTKDKYDGSFELRKDNYITATELKNDEIMWQKARLDLELQESQFYLLQNYTYTRTMAELNNNVTQTEDAYDRAILTSNAETYEAKAQRDAANDKLESEKIIQEKINDQISKTVILAPNDGMVIYASSTKASWRSNDEPLSEGESVHEHEELFHLPKADLVSAIANIHEANLDKVKEGSPVSIKVDAVPGEVFTGVVGKIAVMPDARMVYINPNLKVYKTEIYIDEKPGMPPGTLRTGMGCQVEVVSAQFENAVYVPVQAVITVGDQPTVYVFENGTTIPRAVEIGEDNNRMVQIISGLNKGEQVLLTPPLSQAEVKGNRKRGKGGSGKPGGKGRPGQPGAKKPSDASGGKKRPSGGNRPAEGTRPKNPESK